jgi:hypothetical protein
MAHAMNYELKSLHVDEGEDEVKQGAILMVFCHEDFLF